MSKALKCEQYTDISPLQLKCGMEDGGLLHYLVQNDAAFFVMHVRGDFKAFDRFLL